MKAGVENPIAKYGISNYAAFYICDDPCFSKFGTLRRRCSQPADNFRTFVCVPYGHRWTEHNRAKPMSELASALFSIADANEFRFARFYIVCEAVPLGTLESPLIVCGLSDTLRESPNVEETRNQMQTSGRKKCSHFFQIIVSYAVPAEIYMLCFLAYYLSLQNEMSA